MKSIDSCAVVAISLALSLCVNAETASADANSDARAIASLMSEGHNDMKLTRLIKERFPNGVKLSGRILRINHMKFLDFDDFSVTLETATTPAVIVHASIGDSLLSQFEEAKTGDELLFEGDIAKVMDSNVLMLENWKPHLVSAPVKKNMVNSGPTPTANPSVNAETASADANSDTRAITSLMSEGHNDIKLTRLFKERFPYGVKLSGRITRINTDMKSVTLKTTTTPAIEVRAFVEESLMNRLEDVKIDDELLIEGDFSEVYGSGFNLLKLENCKPHIVPAPSEKKAGNSVLTPTANPNVNTAGASTDANSDACVIASLMSEGHSDPELARLVRERFPNSVKISGRIENMKAFAHFFIVLKTVTTPSFEVHAIVEKSLMSQLNDVKIGDELLIEGDITAVSSLGSKTLVLKNCKPHIVPAPSEKKVGNSGPAPTANPSVNVADTSTDDSNDARAIASLMSEGHYDTELALLLKERFPNGVKLSGRITKKDTYDSFRLTVATTPVIKVFARRIDASLISQLDDAKIGDELSIKGNIIFVNTFGRNTLVLKNCKPHIAPVPQP